MAKRDREGFSTVEADLDELDEKIQLHRKKIFRRTLWCIGILAILFIGIELWMALRTFHSYEVRNSVERVDNEASRFEDFLGNIIKYSNDGIAYMDSRNELIWNQSFEMTTPVLDMCEEYLVIYDQGGMNLYIMKESGLQKQIETTIPIQKVCVANQGTIAVLMKEGTTSYVKLYDKKGNELANGEFYANLGGFPVDIALSYDAQKLAVAMVDVNDGSIKSTITFYNFGSVGQNEINNNVGMFSYPDMLIPQIEFVNSDRMVAIGDSEIIVFEGAQKPQATKEIFLKSEIETVFYNSKYIGVIQSNHDEAVSHHITVYDMNGTVMMEYDTSMAYSKAEFLANNEICLTNEYACEIYTVHSIKKFSYSFDSQIFKIISQNLGVNYVFVLDGVTEEVRLQ